MARNDTLSDFRMDMKRIAESAAGDHRGGRDPSGQKQPVKPPPKPGLKLTK